MLGACSTTGAVDLTLLSPIDYLNKALTIIQTRGMKSANVDWKSTRQKSLELAAGAKSTSDTYSAINYALSQLGDNHSFLIGRNGAGTHPYKVSGTKPKIRVRVESKEVLEDDGKRFGFLVVNGLASTNESTAAEKYAKSLQQQIAQTSKKNPYGWIVDLRGNTGGNMWPMIVGVGPLIGEGTLGYFQYTKIAIPWFYERGQSGVENRSGRHTNFKIQESIADCRNTPVAILIDQATASSGEALTISFRGRPNTIFIGQHTRGLSTNNESIKLADGAVLYLTTSGEADRNHVLYESGIAPDITVEQGDVPLGDKSDPCIKAALKWLNTQSNNCINPTENN